MAHSGSHGNATRTQSSRGRRNDTTSDRIRFNVQMPEKYAELVDDLSAEIGGSTGEVFRRALKFYHYVIKSHSDKIRLVKTNKETGEEQEEIVINM